MKTTPSMLKHLFFLLMIIATSCSDDEAVLSDSKQILGFTFTTEDNPELDEEIDADIDLEADIITLTVPYGTDITALKPEMELSENAAVSPTGAQDFSSPVTYTVTAENGSTASYTVSITIAKNDKNQILSFVFEVEDNTGLEETVVASIDQENRTITASFPYGSNITALVPALEVSEGATVSPTGAQDFTSSITYKITAEDGSSASYAVNIYPGQSNEKQILAFTFEVENNPELEEAVIASIDHENMTITAGFPYGSDITALAPTLEVSEGATVSPTGVQDFTSEVIYEVTAEDGSTVEYTISVSVDESDSKQILSFTFLSEENMELQETVTAIIDEENKTIIAAFPFETNITALTPNIVISENATISPEVNISDFSIPVLYEVMAQNGSTAVYTVTASINPSLPFITTWKTTTANESITIFTNPGIRTYNYEVDWGDGTFESNLTNDATHEYENAGIYTVKIYGDFPAPCIPSVYFNKVNAAKLQTIESWGDIEWESMRYAFAFCTNLTYNANDAPDLRKVTDMTAAFGLTDIFNGDITGWDVGNVESMSGMFEGAKSFNQNIESWNVGNVEDMSYMFRDASTFNQNIESWNVGNVEDMSYMFSGAATFNQNIGSWNVGNVEDMSYMFYEAPSFNQDIGGWDVGNVEYMTSMFSGAISFNQNIGSWNVGNVQNMKEMFREALAFNQNIGSWNVSKVENMMEMFRESGAFNQDIGGWNMSSTRQVYGMFRGASSFNQDIGNWDLSPLLQSLSNMFQDATAFNQDISGWDVSNITHVNYLFQRASAFSQDLSGWNTEMVNYCGEFATDSGLTLEQLPTAGDCF